MGHDNFCEENILESQATLEKKKILALRKKTVQKKKYPPPSAAALAPPDEVVLDASSCGCWINSDVAGRSLLPNLHSRIQSLEIAPHCPT